MECKSPTINIGTKRIDNENGLELDYGFIMDHVSSVRNLSQKPKFQPFLVYPDPEYFPFENSVSELKII